MNVVTDRRGRRRSRRRTITRESADFPTRSYDLVKEFVLAIGFVTALTLVLAGVLSSPDVPPITMSGWAKAAPSDVVATATSELAGTSASATYGPPYNHAADGQAVLGIPLAKWGGVRLPVDSASLVLDPLRSARTTPTLDSALAAWDAGGSARQTSWATSYGDALANAPEGNPASVPAGDYGPVPALTAAFLTLARSGGLEGALTSSGNFYGGDQTRSLLLLSDGAYLENQARAMQLGGDQWGMMNETGNYPGQPWMCSTRSGIRSGPSRPRATRTPWCGHS